MIIKTAKLSHKNKISDGLKKFANISIIGYGCISSGIYQSNNTINNKNNSATNNNYDTFIWTKEILESSEVEIWKKTIINEIKNGKNIYNMARLYRITDYKELVDFAKIHNVEFFDCSNPNLFDEYKEYAKMGLNGIDSKVITIMGTGRQCGKFTTSMVLKHELGKYFKVGTVGTEPQSKLCGIDEMVIPQLVPTCHVASTIFGAIKKVDLNNNDVIIVSGQTGIFSNPLEVGTGRGGGVISIAILLGSNPDYIILASNTDDINCIKKNINTIELLSGKKVIGITINGKNFKDKKILKTYWMIYPIN
ncbi:DUF1611 domain-containing protein [Methanothermococcus okinawensis]|uniref:DUF1611 domain-containing protein n=1 Tax=Methanothermococcus okinawensis (strain DSM 14208 / JCM 11175 / IH1) TaxID=647113 RepID=F8ANC6_METOI|nr:protein of unknown function DUF1611 [Methanothermococcus okinawensis IH1]